MKVRPVTASALHLTISVRRFERWCKTAANAHCKNWSSSRVVLRKFLNFGHENKVVTV